MRKCLHVNCTKTCCDSLTLSTICFNDWIDLSERLKTHELSSNHLLVINIWLKIENKSQTQ